MKTRFNDVTGKIAERATAPAAPEAAGRPSCLPQTPPAEAAAVQQASQVIPGKRKRFRWTIALIGVLVLVAGELAAKWMPLYRPPAVASYNSCLADLDRKLSRSARQLL